MEQAICDLIGQKKYYSTINVAKTLKISRKNANYHLHNCDKVSLVDPLDVGSGKSKIMVWQMKS
jgi:predicted transcriptional regulator